MEKIYSEEEILKIKKIVRIIADRKRQGKKLNRYEYYMLGGIPFRKGEKVVFRLLSERKITTMEANILYKYITFELSLGASRNKEFILKTHYQFGDRVITEIEKQNIWLELNKMGIDDDNIDDLVFSGAVREYAKQNGLIPDTKKRVRKK